MAQLKDTIVTGDLSVTGTIYGDVPVGDLSGYTGTTGFLKKENDSWSLSTVTIPDATSVKGDAETTYRTGQVNLTPANLGISATTSSVTVGSTTFSNVDTKVTQAAAITTAGSYPVLLAYDTNTTAVTNTVNKTSTFVYNPNTSELTTNGTITFGNGTTAILNAKTPSRSSSFIIVGGGKNTAGNADGTAVRLGAGGLTLVGGGEYANNRYNVADLSDRTEALYLGADGAVYIETNGNTIADRKTFTFATDGLLTAPGGLRTPDGSIWAGTLDDTTAERDLGVRSGAGDLYLYSVASTTGNRGLYVHAHGTGAAKNIITVDTNNNTTFTGALSGNASTATKLATARSLKVALGSTTAVTFDGSAAQDSIPVSGTLAIANGGTGATTAAAARTNLLAAAGNGRIFYGTCDTAADTTAKVVTCASYDALTVGDIVIVKFTNTNTGAVGSLTLNVNSKGAKSIKKLYNYSIANLTNAGELYAGTVGMFIYDGAYWILSNADYSSANTQLRVYRQNSSYNGDYPLLVSRTAAGSIGTAGTNSSYSAVYGVMWDDTTKIPTLNPSTGLLKVPGGITANVTGTATNVTGTVAIANGGTGATAKKAAKTNLGITYGTAAPSGGADGDIYIQYNTSSVHPFLDLVYPVGAIYLSTVNTSPATLFGGTWTQIKDRFLLAAGDTYTAGNTGGSATHTLTEAQLPSISGTFDTRKTSINGNSITAVSGKFAKADVTKSDNWNYFNSTASVTQNERVTFAFGSGQAHNNMPPYLVVYAWKRTA